MTELPFSDEVAEQIYRVLYAGRKIEAIKIHREATRSGLKESKDFIDALEAELRRESPEKFTAKASGCAIRMAMLAAVATAMWMWA